ncbi:sigma-70 family RNA polymerase sigma factor [Kamptonema cortianum]|nr:sigma-70 family RNA polymerase sigma factor [Geitlerinema splendidum]MDK3155226.1 sigma-70 family RNA polymerase sigma factor [Kamptonema cortianum]
MKEDFEHHVASELPVLFRVARRMGCSAEEAEDVVQQTMLKAFRAWHTFDGRHIRSWLIRILRNERLMELRSKKSTVSLDEPETDEIADAPFWQDVAGNFGLELIINEINELPEIYRWVVQLCDVEETTYEEAAEALDVPIGTVRSRLFRARAILRDRLVALDPVTFEEVSK